MATTIKNFISTDSPQYEEHIATRKVQILQNFLKYTTFKTYYCRRFFGQPRLFLTLGVAVLNTINTHKFHPKRHTGLEIQNSITIFHGHLFGIF